MQILFFIVGLLVALSVFVLTLWAKESADLVRFRESLIHKERRGVMNFLKALIVPFLKKVHFLSLRRRIDQLLVQSGDRDRISVDEWVASNLIGFALLLILFLFFGYSPVKATGLTMILTIVYVGGNHYSKMSRRRMEVRQNLPLLLDMLSLSVEAGMGLISAIRRIVSIGKDNIVTAELGRVQNQIALGMPQDEAFREMGERLADASVRAFVGTLIQSKKIGSPIAPVLKAYAEKTRFERHQRAERAGTIAAQKVLLPLVLLIMPSVFIIIFGPLVVMWRSGMLGSIL